MTGSGPVSDRQPSLSGRVAPTGPIAGRSLVDRFQPLAVGRPIYSSCSRVAIGCKFTCSAPPLPLQAARRSALLLRIFKNPAPATIVSFGAAFSSSASDASGTTASTPPSSVGRSVIGPPTTSLIASRPATGSRAAFAGRSRTSRSSATGPAGTIQRLFIPAANGTAPAPSLVSAR